MSHISFPDHFEQTCCVVTHQVPVSASVAAAVRRNADDEAREREEMKRLVLATHTKQQAREDGGFILQVRSFFMFLF